MKGDNVEPWYIDILGYAIMAIGGTVVAYENLIKWIKRKRRKS